MTDTNNLTATFTATPGKTFSTESDGGTRMMMAIGTVDDGQRWAFGIKIANGTEDHTFALSESAMAAFLTVLSTTLESEPGLMDRLTTAVEIVEDDEPER